MADTFKFPNGFPVDIVRKSDIFDSFDDDADKDIMVAIVNKCESDIADFVAKGKWTGVPFLGSIRIPKTLQKFMSQETIELMIDAANTLDKKRYAAFRRDLGATIGKEVKGERYFKYVVSQMVAKNKKLYNHFIKKHTGSSCAESYAMIEIYSTTMLEYIKGDE